jgi:hypothetical protein
MGQDFDLSGVNRIVADRFRSRRAAFTAIGAVTLPTILVVAVWFGLFGPTGPLLRAGVVTWAVILAWYGGAYGFVSARRLAAGPSGLRIDQKGISLILANGRTRHCPWTGSSARFWMNSRSTHIAGIPDYSLVIRPRITDLFPPYRGILPVMPLTREAFEALLDAARGHGASIVSQPSSRFLGVEAPGVSHIFELPSRTGNAGFG